MYNSPIEGPKTSFGMFPSWGLGNVPADFLRRSVGTFPRCVGSQDIAMSTVTRRVGRAPGGCQLGERAQAMADVGIEGMTISMPDVHDLEAVELAGQALGPVFGASVA